MTPPSSPQPLRTGNENNRARVGAPRVGLWQEVADAQGEVGEGERGDGGVGRED